jgi:dTDP-glucose pyrophosphorylase
MAGEGSRFRDAGYTFPKPLIDVNGKAMVAQVIDTLPDCEEYIFMCRFDHLEKYKLEEMLQSATDHRATIIPVHNLTEGAACTALLAKYCINDEKPLIIANSDQFVDYNKQNFKSLVNFSEADGIIFTFNACHPKWSFAELDENGQVVRVEEKNPISNVATCGLYYFSSGSLFIRAAESMIAKDIRTNGEFYLCPVYNELKEHIILPFFVDKMFGLGTPEDLEAYLQWKS